MNHQSQHVFLAVVVVGLLLSAGTTQLAVELARGRKPQLIELFGQAPTVANLRAFEQALEDQSWLAQQVRPWMQYVQYVLLRDVGNKALMGLDGWFFYKPGVEYITRRSPAQQQTDDPVAAICDFRDQLARRGIRLLVMPAPNKETVYPEQLSRRAARLRMAVSQQTQSVLRRLREAGVEVVDLFELYARQKEGRPPHAALYLAQDSHWSPAGLKCAAKAVADRLVELGWVQKGRAAYAIKQIELKRLGDVIRMLKVPPLEARVAPEVVQCEQVIDLNTGRPYQDSADAEVLVLGDSFLKIFERDEPGSAGFIAHLAEQLRQPLASLVNEGGASTLVRQELHRRPALLKNKKVVVWEFVERDIRLGTEGWQKVPLPSASDGSPGDSASAQPSRNPPDPASLNTRATQ